MYMEYQHLYIVYPPKFKDKLQNHPYGTQFKMQAANTEIVTTTNSVNFNDVSIGFGPLVSSLFEVAKGDQLAVKQLKGTNSYSGAVQQV